MKIKGDLLLPEEKVKLLYLGLYSGGGPISTTRSNTESAMSYNAPTEANKSIYRKVSKLTNEILKNKIGE